MKRISENINFIVEVITRLVYQEPNKSYGFLEESISRESIQDQLRDLCSFTRFLPSIPKAFIPSLQQFLQLYSSEEVQKFVVGSPSNITYFSQGKTTMQVYVVKPILFEILLAGVFAAYIYAVFLFFSKRKVFWGAREVDTSVGLRFSPHSRGDHKILSFSLLNEIKEHQVPLPDWQASKGGLLFWRPRKAWFPFFCLKTQENLFKSFGMLSSSFLVFSLFVLSARCFNEQIRWYPFSPIVLFLSPPHSLIFFFSSSLSSESEVSTAYNIGDRVVLTCRNYESQWEEVNCEQVILCPSIFDLTRARSSDFTSSTPTT